MRGHPDEHDVVAVILNTAARMAYESVRNFYAAFNIAPTLPDWKDCGHAIKAKYLNAAMMIARYPDTTASMIHVDWAMSLANEGWRYGPEFDRENRMNPLLVDFDKLPPTVRACDEMTWGVVRSVVLNMANPLSITSYLDALDRGADRFISAQSH